MFLKLKNVTISCTCIGEPYASEIQALINNAEANEAKLKLAEEALIKARHDCDLLMDGKYENGDKINDAGMFASGFAGELDEALAKIREGRG